MRSMDQAQQCYAENKFSCDSDPLEYRIYNVEITSEPHGWISALWMSAVPLLKQSGIHEVTKWPILMRCTLMGKQI